MRTISMCPQFEVLQGLDLIYPDLHNGPCEDFGIEQVEVLPRTTVIDSVPSGEKEYLEKLEQAGLLKACLDLRHGKAIKESLDYASFYGFFGNKGVPLWKSVAKNGEGSMFVPVVRLGEYGVEIEWESVELAMHSDIPVIR